MNEEISADSKAKQHDKTYLVDIEGTVHEWQEDTITVEQLIALGGWDLSVGVIEVDKENNERTLAAGEVVELKPGHGFAKKIHWKRGDSLFEARLDEELQLLLSRYPGTRRIGQWFLLPSLPLPAVGWDSETADLVLRVQPGYPAVAPYGFFVPAGLRIQGALPDNYQEPIGESVPFPGTWGMFSWAVDDGQWRPTATAKGGANLLNFAIGISVRLQQGK
ncbi:MAG: hypothetical protein ACJ8LG_01040 [Massilia sp.]